MPTRTLPLPPDADPRGAGLITITAVTASDPWSELSRITAREI